MNEPTISIIIPVYNTEKYLKKCLDSVITQTYKNLEIICINDGSTDSSLKILKKYAKSDKRIKVINQENKGVSITRNIGIENATGEWITFIDSDDYISPELYQSFTEALNNSEPFNIYVFNGVKLAENDNPEDKNLTKFFYMSNWNFHENNLYTFIDCKNPFYGNLSVWNKIFNTEFINNNNIRFKENSIFEDQLFSIESMIKTDKLYLDNKIFYYYVQHGNSTMHNLKENGFDIFDIMQDVRDLLCEYNLYETEKYLFLQHKFNVYTYLLSKMDLSLKEKFYNTAKDNLHKEALNNFFTNRIKQLPKSFLFFDFVSLSFDEFIQKHRV